jgi:biopolymer transport protein ExbD
MARKRREHLTPDLTPLIDVVFILLIFFIVSSVFKKDELALNLNLPSSTAKEVDVEIKQITLELSSDKLAYLGELVSLDQLDMKLLNVTNKEKPVIFRIDKDVKYERVVKVLDVLQKHSLNNLSLVTNEEE